MKSLKLVAVAAALVALASSSALATPSTQIWIPSTDVQAFKTVHLGIDNYLRADRESNGTRFPNLYDLGLTAGVLPFEKVQMEVGIDYMSYGNAYDNYPLYLNAKLGTPENSLFKDSPALAIGGYNFGSNSSSGSAFRTDQNIIYALAAKTLPVVGRLSAGYFTGNNKVLLDENGKKENNGILLSWDRTISEISDNLWAAVDYQGSNSAMGALSFGVAWSFSKNVSLIVGYDIYNNDKVAGKNTFTTQLDINFP
ncbi:MAG TPA: hypothetical protein HPP97_10930 [Desulfuromonadales bacterium]|nr:hypothetical protein [Desulfuromonadales bacterium]